MASIEAIHARQILDSRGNPTLEVEVALDDGTVGRAGVPSGASTGAFEAVELRDGGAEYGGKGVTRAVQSVIDEIQPELLGHEADDQRLVDQALIDLDRTPDKSRLGANAIVGVSMAVARAAADSSGLPLFRYLGGPNAHVLPVPMMNILNGGAHADNNVDIQEFMIAPIGAADVHRGAALGRRGLPRAEVGDQAARPVHRRRRRGRLRPGPGAQPGRARPDRRGDRQGRVHPRPGRRAGDRRGGVRVLLRRRVQLRGQAADVGGDDRASTPTGWTPTRSCRIEDPLAEEDWPGWQELTAAVGDRVQVVGDDIFVTNPERIRRGIAEQLGQLPAGQGEPDRHGHRDPGRGEPGPARRVQPA